MLPASGPVGPLILINSFIRYSLPADLTGPEVYEGCGPGLALHAERLHGDRGRRGGRGGARTPEHWVLKLENRLL